MIGVIGATGTRGYCWITAQDNSYYGHFYEFTNAPPGHFRCSLRTGMEVSFDPDLQSGRASPAAINIKITDPIESPDGKQVECELVFWDEFAGYGFVRLPCNCRAYVHISDVLTAEEYHCHLRLGTHLVADVIADKRERLRCVNVEIIQEAKEEEI